MPRLSETHQNLPAYDLKATREKLVASQGEMAELLFTTQASIARWEKSGQLPSLHRAYLAFIIADQKKTKKAKKAK